MWVAGSLAYLLHVGLASLLVVQHVAEHLPRLFVLEDWARAPVVRLGVGVLDGHEPGEAGWG